MSNRHLVRPAKSSFRFDTNEPVVLKNPSVDIVLDAVQKKHEQIQFDELEGKSIDPTGMIEQSGMRFSPYGFARLCRALEIPKRFIDDISKYNPGLASELINDIVRRKGRKHTLALDGNVVEGVVSTAYSRLENSRVAEIVAEVTGSDKFASLKLEGLRMRLNHLGNMEDMRDWSSNKRMIEERGLHKGDILGGGIDVYNGEDGGTSFNVAAYIYRVLCANGMIGPGPGPGGGGGKRLVHRGSGLREKAMVMIQRSQDICMGYLEKMPQAASITLNALEQRELMGRIQNEFSLVFANRVMEKAGDEANAEGHPKKVSLYNVFNGVTFQAHESRSLDRARHIEQFASKLLDQGLRITGEAA